MVAIVNLRFYNSYVMRLKHLSLKTLELQRFIDLNEGMITYAISVLFSTFPQSKIIISDHIENISSQPINVATSSSSPISQFGVYRGVKEVQRRKKSTVLKSLWWVVQSVQFQIRNFGRIVVISGKSRTPTSCT